MKYRKKPVVIDAFQFIPENFDAILEWSTKARPIVIVKSKDGKAYCGEIETLEGAHLASPGDFIIKGVKGEVYPCKPDIFEMTYEPAED